MFTRRGFSLLLTAFVWGVVLAQPPQQTFDDGLTPEQRQAEANTRRATGGAVLCGNNPFCLPEHMRPSGSTSGEAR